MPIVKLDHVSKYYGANLVLDDICWQVSADDRIGLIGDNGTGKTTLFKIMTGEITHYKGNVERAKRSGIGHLHQEAEYNSEMKLRDAIRTAAFSHMYELEARMRELAEEMVQVEDDDDMEEILNDYARLQERHEAHGGYDYEHRIDAILGGLGFTHDDFDLPVGVLSGGQKSRAALAQLLLEEPDLLLLDEPTNHLDLEGTEWLESFINSDYKGAVVVVSHDRYFLDKVVTKVAELQNHKLGEYSGNYTQYIYLKEQNLLTQQRRYIQQQEEIERDKDFIRRYHAGQRSREAKGREKKLERMELIEKPQLHNKTIKLEFKTDIRGGDDVLLLRNVSKKYNDKVLFENLDLDIYRQDRVGIIGPNGVGKTTLLRLIMGLEKPTTGTVKLGANLRVGYYDQEHAGLNLNNSVLDEIWELRPDDTQGEVRSYLGRFLFSDDEVFKTIQDLSGGEQSRVALAKLLLGNANFLILDEPTNHLDISSKEVLEEALLEYPSTALIVSHDRYFLDKIVNKIVFMETSNTRLWTGNYTDYQEWKLEKKREEEAKAAEERKRLAAERKKREAEERRRSAKGSKKKKRKKKKKPPKRTIGI
jgi:ATP-binding cassette subfamily F protein 3